MLQVKKHRTGMEFDDVLEELRRVEEVPQQIGVFLRLLQQQRV